MAFTGSGRTSRSWLAFLVRLAFCSPCCGRGLGRIVIDVSPYAQSRVAGTLCPLQIALGAVPLLIAAYFVVGNRINWAVLVIGLASRLWLFLYSLPFLVAAL